MSNHLILKLPEKEVNSEICKLNMKQQIDLQQQERLQYFLSKRNTDREQKRDVMVDDDANANSKKEQIYQNAFAHLVKEKDDEIEGVVNAIPEKERDDEDDLDANAIPKKEKDDEDDCDANASPEKKMMRMMVMRILVLKKREMMRMMVMQMVVLRKREMMRYMEIKFFMCT